MYLYKWIGNKFVQFTSDDYTIHVHKFIKLSIAK